MKQSKNKIGILTECAIMVAAAVVLSMIKIVPELPFGGSVTLISMAPLIVISIRHGVRYGIFSSLVYSLTQLLLGLSNFSYLTTPAAFVVCILFDYVIAFTALGVAGAFRRVRIFESESKNLLVTTILGVTLAVVLRFLCHLISGAVIWHTLTLGWYADDPTHFVHRYGAWTYSLLYNGGYMLPELVLTLIATPPIVAATSRIKTK